MTAKYTLLDQFKWKWKCLLEQKRKDKKLSKKENTFLNSSTSLTNPVDAAFEAVK